MHPPLTGPPLPHPLQVFAFGGRAARILTKSQPPQWYPQQTVYTLDLLTAPPRWRKASAPGAMPSEGDQISYPSSGLAVVPELGALTLTYPPVS